VLGFLKTVLETCFRLFGFPTKTGLRTFGNPDPDAPVFLTCNFDLTVRRVSKVLEGMDCYLLVAPSKGINVWCAAGGGILNAHSVISVLKTSGINERVNHRTLIMPQLAAPGVDVKRVEEETGWHCKFGPVRAADIPAYVRNNFQKSQEMSLVRFPLQDRVETAVMWAFPISIVVVIVLAILAPASIPGALALIWGSALALYILFDPIMRYVPGPVSLVKTLLLGLVMAAGLVAYGLLVGNWSTGKLIGWSVGALLLMLVMGFDLEGQTPLLAPTSITYWGTRYPDYFILKLFAVMGYVLEPFFTVHVDAEKCAGCGTCVEVCPKGVYALHRVNAKLKSHVVNLAACEQCTACVKQCTYDAIWSEPPIRSFTPKS
jgi:NAD-dependent dihydropyrimidine dehydrogenase PreA subunit